MAQYTPSSDVRGAWAKGKELKEKKIARAKILTEAKPQPSSFTDKNGNPKTQDVCKVKFDGLEEELNMSLNKATIGGLIKAFGTDSKDWVGKVLSVETETVRVAGKANIAVYLIPAGYVKVDDEGGYAVIVKEGEEDEVPTIDLDEPERPF